jgi:hypothetical protein
MIYPPGRAQEAVPLVLAYAGLGPEAIVLGCGSCVKTAVGILL